MDWILQFFAAGVTDTAWRWHQHHQWLCEACAMKFYHPKHRGQIVTPSRAQWVEVRSFQ